MTRGIVIAGGGTGGHVFVASAIAEALRQAGCSDEELCFIGSKRGMERELLAEESSPVILLGGRVSSARGNLVPCSTTLAPPWGYLVR